MIVLIKDLDGEITLYGRHCNQVEYIREKEKTAKYNSYFSKNIKTKNKNRW